MSAHLPLISVHKLKRPATAHSYRPAAVASVFSTNAFDYPPGTLWADPMER